MTRLSNGEDQALGSVSLIEEVVNSVRRGFNQKKEKGGHRARIHATRQPWF
jgi:hypothetical protein